MIEYAQCIVLGVLLIAICLSIPWRTSTRRSTMMIERRQDSTEEEFEFVPGQEMWTNAEMDLPGVDPRRTDMTKAQQIALSQAGVLGNRRVMLERRNQGVFDEIGIESVDAEVIEDPQLPSGAPQLPPGRRPLLGDRSARSKRLLGG